MVKSDVNIKNKRASFDYEFIDTYSAGIQLTGTEIKSIRENKASINEGFCYIENSEAFIKNMYIAPYDKGSYNNHEPRRTRKLLLNKTEIQKIEKKVKIEGITIVPTKLFINEKGLAKLNIAVSRGKKTHDKRNDLKEKDARRDMDRAKKRF